MIQTITKLYEGDDLSGATPGVIYLPILDFGRVLNEIVVLSDEDVSGADAVFQLKLNGDVIAGAEAITVAVGNKISNALDGLEIELTQGDELVSDLLSGSISSPVTLSLFTTVSVYTDEITEVADKNYVTDDDLANLANLSGTNSGDETTATIKTKLGISTLSGANTGDQDLSGYATKTGAETLTNKTLTTPTIGSFVNANHNHQDSAGGGTLAESALALTDITTNNVSTTKHGFAPKLPNDAAKYLDGTGAYSVPAGGGGGGGAVASVNSKTGTVVLDPDDLSDAATTNKFVTAAEKTKLSNLSNTNSGDETAGTIGAIVNGSSAATPNNTDLVATVESSVVKKITWTNVKAFLKTYFDTLYQAVLVSGTNIKTVNSTSILGSGDIPISDATITTTDITTNNASTSKHGFLKKLSNTATEYMDGTGNWSTPAGGSGTRVSVKKTSSENRSSTTTLADDAALSFAVAANKAYQINIYIPLFTATTTPNIKFGLSYPTTSCQIYGLKTTANNAGSLTTNAIGPSTGTYTNQTLSLNGLGWIKLELTYRSGASNSGTFSFQWAQNTSSTDVTQVSNGALLDYLEI